MYILIQFVSGEDELGVVSAECDEKEILTSWETFGNVSRDRSGAAIEGTMWSHKTLWQQEVLKEEKTIACGVKEFCS